MKKAIFLFVTIFLFNSCKKDESWEYWDNLAEKKYEEIIALSNSYACSETSNLTTQVVYNICASTILVHKNDLKRFEELYKQFLSYEEKANKLGRPAITAMCAMDSSIKIGCKDNKAYLLNAYNISLEDLNIEMPKLYTEIKNHYNSLTCENINNLTGMTLYTGDVKEAIAIKNTDGSYYNKVQMYRLLNHRKAELEKKQLNLNYSLKVNVKCENNSIKAEFE